MTHSHADTRNKQQDIASDQLKRTQGETIRAWRQHRRLSLADAADRAGLGKSGRSWLSRVETNHIRKVNDARLQALAQALKVPVGALKAGNLPPEFDPLTGAIATPADSRAVRRRASSPQAQIQQAIDDLRDDVRALTERIDVLLGEYVTSSLVREVSAPRGAPGQRTNGPTTPEPIAEEAPPQAPEEAPNSDDSSTPGAASAGRRRAQPHDDAPLLHAANLRDEWSAVIERIHSSVSEHPNDEAPRVWFGQHSVKVFQSDSEKFARSMANLEALTGDRCLVLDGISECFVPIEAHAARGAALVEQHQITQTSLNHILQSRRQRSQALNEQLSKHDCVVRDLYTWSAIERLVKTGRYALDDRFTRLGAPRLTDPEIVTTLNTLISFMIGYRDTYEVRFVDDPQPEWPCFWMVKAGAYLQIEMWVAHPRFREAAASGAENLRSYLLATQGAADTYSPFMECELEIYDTRTVQFFQRYFFDELWNQVPFRGRDRDTLIRRLEEEIDIVRRRTPGIRA